MPYSTVSDIEILYRDASQGVAGPTSSPVVIVILNSPPALGKDPVSLRRVDDAPTVVFTLGRDEIPRLHQALKSRRMVSLLLMHSASTLFTQSQDQLVKINKDMKLSVLSAAANLEMDSTGNLASPKEVSTPCMGQTQLPAQTVIYLLASATQKQPLSKYVPRRV